MATMNTYPFLMIMMILFIRNRTGKSADTRQMCRWLNCSREMVV